MRNLFIALMMLCSVNLVQAEDKPKEKKQEVKENHKNFTGVIKTRKGKDDADFYYIELKDGERIHISKNVDDATLKPFLNKRVKVKSRLRPKTTDMMNDFIRQIYKIEEVK